MFLMRNRHVAPFVLRKVVIFGKLLRAPLFRHGIFSQEVVRNNAENVLYSPFLLIGRHTKKLEYTCSGDA